MSTTQISAATGWIDETATQFAAIVPEHIDRLTWDAERLRAHQDRALADLVRTAATWSPFHRRRLAGIDAAEVGVDRLAELPIMDKSEMMDDLDEVFTDCRLTRGLVERHLAGLSDEPELLLDEYVVLASGGSSGTRGVFVSRRHDVAGFTACVLRAGMARVSASTGWPPPTKIPVALVLAPHPMHATRAMSRAMSGVAELTDAPVTLPIEEIIGRLNDSRPMVVVGYPSVMARLGDARVDGLLHIEPTMTLTTSEQLRPDHVERMVAGFGMPPGNSFGSTEGLIGSAAPGSEEFTFASDRAIIEFVDADDRPVAVGTPAHHVLVTDFTSHTQPLIRYRMDDAMTELPPVAEHGHQRATVDGRNDPPLTIGDVIVHPLVIRSTLLRHDTISDYQVRVTPPENGDSKQRRDANVHIAVVTTGRVDMDRVSADVSAAIEAAGASADVVAAPVDDLERDRATGKIRRFIVSASS